MVPVSLSPRDGELRAECSGQPFQLSSVLYSLTHSFAASLSVLSIWSPIYSSILPCTHPTTVRLQGIWQVPCAYVVGPGR